jgi:hypothetical protein
MQGSGIEKEHLEVGGWESVSLSEGILGLKMFTADCQRGLIQREI